MGDDIKFRLKQDSWVTRHNPAQSLKGVLSSRAHTHYGQGELEDMKDSIEVLEQINAALLEGLITARVLTPQDVCDIVNKSSGYDIEVAEDG